jgi:hypothetical protein
VELTEHAVGLQLVDLYENDCIFDKFDCCLSGDGQHLATGSYNNLFRVFGVRDAADLILEASRDPQRRRLQAPTPARVRTSPLHTACLQCCFHSAGTHACWEHPAA